MSITTTSRRRWKNRRPDIDHKAVRYFIYRLHDAEGRILYIGRSCDVAARIKAHHSDATHRYMPELSRKREWLFKARRVSMVGPFTWGEACRVERAEIEAHQPEGNRMFTEAHGWRRRSA